MRKRLIAAVAVCVAALASPLTAPHASAAPLFSQTCATMGCINDFVGRCDDAGGVVTGTPNGASSIELDCSG